MVEMALIVNGKSSRVVQMGGDFIILGESVEYPPTSAELTLEIDGELEKWSVYLPKGIRKNRTRTPVECKGALPG
jgi:hypothetical protein